ncbi:PCMD domain-containing protein [Mangrovimonas cancribranchiae]|uniref:PCMD domain-containing protein n=1 Tax=Mangrovimonas cancribranchiae TaxID=3080055 RepID=A0AAU6P0J6_9FLAO
MRFKVITLTVFLITLCVSCVDEDYFGASNYANILSIEISSQSGTPIINTEEKTVEINVANGVDVAQLILNKLEVSPFATANISEGDVLNFSNGFIPVSITAESGSVTNWEIIVTEIGSEPQIDNSNFNTWYNQGDYLDLGQDDASSSWGTSNPGVVFGGISPNVLQQEITSGNYAVKLITRYTSLGAVVNKPIAAGSVFTGDFLEDEITLANPQAAVSMGIPFTATPTSFTVDYQYMPGDTNIDANQNELTYPDVGDIYILLERREESLVKRVATAWYRVEEANSNLETISVDFIYGELPQGTPSYMQPQNNEIYAQENESPTHIKVVFSSSAFGDYFQGAEGSELTIDNLVLNY